jgi:crotonobetaine/carnitine-CoA ligase
MPSPSRPERGPTPTLLGLLRTAAMEEPNREWLSFVGGPTYTFGEVWAHSAEVAGGLERAGIGPGDRIALFLDNRPEFLFTWFAARMIGAIAVPMNTAAKGAVLEHYMTVTGSKAAVVEDRLHRRLADAARSLESTPTFFVVGPTACGVDFDALRGSPHEGSRDARGRETAAILFTSGTTGRSKGVTFSERFLANFARLAHEILGFRRSDVLHDCLPLFHANALILFTCGSLFSRARIVLSPRFSVRAFWREVRESGATVSTVIGAMATLLLQQEPSSDERDHALKRLMVVPAPAHYYQTLQDRFGVPPIDMYGMTDAGIFVSNRWGDELRPGSCGRVIDGYECAIVDDDDEPVPPGVVGELLVRPTAPGMISDGYWNMPEETVAAWRGLWFRTGDYVHRDADGWFYFVDRKKDAIRRRGENISSYEVEEAFLSHPDVLEAAAYPVRSDLTEDEVALAVVLRPGASVAAERLLSFVDDRLAYYALPRYVTFHDELPKTPTAKVQKQVLIAEGIRPDTWDMLESGYEPTR